MHSKPSGRLNNFFLKIHLHSIYKQFFKMKSNPEIFKRGKLKSSGNSSRKSICTLNLKPLVSNLKIYTMYKLKSTKNE